MTIYVSDRIKIFDIICETSHVRLARFGRVLLTLGQDISRHNVYHAHVSAFSGIAVGHSSLCNKLNLRIRKSGHFPFDNGYWSV